MSNSEKLKRYLIFFVGLFINSLGVSLITTHIFHPLCSQPEL